LNTERSNVLRQTQQYLPNKLNANQSFNTRFTNNTVAASTIEMLSPKASTIMKNRGGRNIKKRLQFNTVVEKKRTETTTTATPNSINRSPIPSDRIYGGIRKKF